MEDEYIQQDMFDNTELDFIKSEIKVVWQKANLAITRSDNCRKGLFARHNELEKRIQKLEEDQEKLLKFIDSIKNERHIPCHPYIEEIRLPEVLWKYS